MVILITLTTAGADTGPFNLFSNVDGFSSPFETGVSKAALLAGYTTLLAPPGTTVVRVKSAGTCTNQINVNVVPCSITTTTTSSSTSSTTTTTTTIVGECATFDLTGGTGGGSWTALECGTLTPVGGDIDEGVTIDSGCIVISSLSLSNVSSANETAC